jgi:hypothetical protein
MHPHLLPRSALIVTILVMIVCAIGAPVHAQPRDTVLLSVEAGRPLRVALDERVRLSKGGQPLTGTIVEAVYAYDRIVIPAGTKVAGHIVRLDDVPKNLRVGAMLGGDFTPLRRAVLEFNELILGERRIQIRTVVTGETRNLQRVTAPSDAPQPTGARGRAREEISRAEAEVKAQAKDAVLMITRPGKMARLRDALASRMPYHRQYLAQGTVYNAELQAPLDFGRAVPLEPAPEGSQPAPSSLLKVRLTTALDSKESMRGTPVAAVLTEPVFSDDRQLILPQGTALRGSVTQATPAKHFRRNGTLRFLFERVEPAAQASAPLLASLHSVEAGASERFAVDEEGGATVTNSKARFIAPAVAIAALTVLTDPQESVAEIDEGVGAASSRVAGRGAGGFIGLGFVGMALGYASKPVALGLGLFGATRVVYSSVFGRGKDVKFAADTPLQLQLSPRSAPSP